MTPVIPLARARTATRYAQLVLPLLLLPAIAYPQSEADAVGLGYESATESHRGFDASDGPSWIEPNEAVGRIGGWRTYARELYEPENATDQDAATVEPDTGATVPESEMGAKSAGDMATPDDPDATQTAIGPDEPAMADAESQRVATLQYDSVLETYEPYEETDGPNWIEANDAVGKIGGWRTYARELYESDSDEGETQ